MLRWFLNIFFFNLSLILIRLLFPNFSTNWSRFLTFLLRVKCLINKVVSILSCPHLLFFILKLIVRTRVEAILCIGIIILCRLFKGNNYHIFLGVNTSTLIPPIHSPNIFNFLKIICSYLSFSAADIPLLNCKGSTPLIKYRCLNLTFVDEY